MYHKKTFKQIIVICICVFVGAIYVANNFLFIKSVNQEEKVDVRLGIIDGHISDDHENLVKECVNTYESKKTHGDQVLNFLMQYAPNLKYYYYDVEDENGLSTKNILCGLEWMKDNDVDCVSISLSSKFYSDELEAWIQNNKSKITVYASYNNVMNSLDYPAMYEDTIGVGASEKINKKKKDVIFATNKILVLGNEIHYYCGNSYLTPYVMIKENIIQ